MKIGLAVVFFASLVVFQVQQPPLAVVPSIDFNRYAGRWYEIARLPNRFQTQCVGEVTADYTPQPNGRIRVVNRCRVSGDGFDEAEGVARRSSNDRPNSELKVRFAPAFLSLLPWVWGDYQVIALAADYSHAVVGAPSREYLWILARTPEIPSQTYESLVQLARNQGFDVSRLEKTRQTQTR